LGQRPCGHPLRSSAPGLKPVLNCNAVRIHSEERLGSLVAAGGIIWAVQASVSHLRELSTLILPQGPLEVCAVGILIWIHAKWRRSVAPQ
jgi:hypothetical protein